MSFDHETSRKKICGVCFRKIKPIELRDISDNLLQLILKHYYKDYSLDDMPLVICTSCCKTLQVIESGCDSRKLPAIQYPKNCRPKTATRSQYGCACDICAVARITGFQFKNYSEKQRKKPGRPSKMDISESKMTICTQCFSKLGKGLQHNCKSTANRGTVKFKIIDFQT